MSDGVESQTSAIADTTPENPRAVAAALACVWFAVGSVVVGMGLILGAENSDSARVLVPIIITLMFLQIPCVIAVLVLSIFGGMWRSPLDAVMSAVLIVLTLGADLMLWPLTTQSGFGAVSYGPCDGSGPCGPRTSDTDLWIGVGAQTLVLAILLVSSAHWIWRLRPDTAHQKANRLGLLVVAAAFVAALIAIDTNIDTGSQPGTPEPAFGSQSSFGSGSGPGSGPSQVTLTNDLGYPVRLVYCPLQRCGGQKATLMAANASATFTVHSSGGVPDSFVVLSSGNQPICATVDFPMGGMSGADQPDVPLSTADAGTCGSDLQSLTVPH